MKNIVFFCPSGLNNPGGAERVLSLIANELDKLSYHVAILSYEKEKESFYPISKSIKRLDLNYKPSSSRLKNLLLFFEALNNCRTVIKSNRTDVIIPLGIEAAIIVAISLIFINKIKKMVWIHYSFFHKLNFRDKVFRKIFAKQYDKIIVLNKTDKERYSELYPNTVEHIPNPVSFYSDECTSLDHKTFIAVGRIDKIKAFDLLISAFNIVVHEYGNIDWKLNIYGKDGGEKASLNNLVRKLNLENNVFIRDAVSNIKREYLNSDIYVMTSVNECFPMVLLEAQEVGLPIISFNCESGPRDIVNNGSDGILIKPYEVYDFADAMSSLIKNPELMKKMSVNAKQNIRKFYLDTIITKWQDLL